MVTSAPAAPTLTNIKWTLYQDFLDQLPVDNTGFAQLPPIDIAYALCYQMIDPGSIIQARVHRMGERDPEDGAWMELSQIGAGGVVGKLTHCDASLKSTSGGMSEFGSPGCSG